MQCPHCGYNGSKVVDSRPTDDGRVIRRRRECEHCGFRFTTFERVEVTPLLVVKKNGNREEFNREKLLKGIVRSAEKRPVSMDAITNLVDRVENKLRSLGENEVSSQQIGEYVMEDLVNLDEIAISDLPVFTVNSRICQSFIKSSKKLWKRIRKRIRTRIIRGTSK